MGTIDGECLNLPINLVQLCREWIADRRCGVGTTGSECLNLVPIALVQAMDGWIADCRCGMRTIGCECLNLVPIALVQSMDGLLIGDAEWEPQGVSV